MTPCTVTSHSHSVVLSSPGSTACRAYHAMCLSVMCMVCTRRSLVCIRRYSPPLILQRNACVHAVCQMKRLLLHQQCFVLCRWWLQALGTCACTTTRLTKCSGALWWAGLPPQMALSISLPLALCVAFCPSACLLPSCLSLPFSMPFAGLPIPALCFASCPSACLLLGCLSLPFALPPVFQHAFCLAVCLCPLPSTWAITRHISLCSGMGLPQ